MATYLCMRNSRNETKRYAAKDSAPPKPYLRVNDKFLQLTTETSTDTGLRIRKSNSTYRIVESYTTTRQVDTTLNTTTGVDTSSTYEEYHTRIVTYSTTQEVAHITMANGLNPIHKLTSYKYNEFNNYYPNSTFDSRANFSWYIYSERQSKSTSNKYNNSGSEASYSISMTSQHGFLLTISVPQEMQNCDIIFSTVSTVKSGYGDQAETATPTPYVSAMTDRIIKKNVADGEYLGKIYWSKPSEWPRYYQSAPGYIYKLSANPINWFRSSITFSKSVYFRYTSVANTNQQEQIYSYNINNMFALLTRTSNGSTLMDSNGNQVQSSNVMQLLNNTTEFAVNAQSSYSSKCTMSKAWYQKKFSTPFIFYPNDSIYLTFKKSHISTRYYYTYTRTSYYTEESNTTYQTTSEETITVE